MPPSLRARPGPDPAAPNSAGNSDPPILNSHVTPPCPPGLIRALTAHDVPAIERMLRALDVDSRCARFGWASSDDSLMAHSRGLVANATHLIGAFAFGELRGIVEICGATAAEVTLVVTPQFRRRGFGRAMLAAAVAWAGESGVTSIDLIFSRDNWPMRRIAAAGHARLDIALDEIRATIHVLHEGLA